MRIIIYHILLLCILTAFSQSFTRNDLKRGNTVLLENVNFFSNKTEMLPSSLSELDTLAQYMDEYPLLAIELVGHTDTEGDKKFNKKISQKRASAVRNYLIKKGVDEKRVNAIGMGDNKPLTKESNPFNQRMEFVVISNPGVKRPKKAKKILKEPGRDTSNQKRVALVIGNSNYENSSVLKNPLNDARDMTLTLRDLGFEVKKILDANQVTMLEGLKHFSKNINNADVVLFYFAGHGIQVGDKNYLLPTDAQFENGESDVHLESINLDVILRLMEYTNKKSLNMIILDACRNNPFKTWTRGGDEGLAEVKAPSGTIVAYSTSPGSVSFDGKGENGLYTSVLINQLKLSQRIEDVFINTRIQVEETSEGKQSPWELARLRGKFYLK
ncbi:MAG: caspase family protein [Cyclobacteriaceae bacterium]